jgi:hypothetical protein
MQVTTNRWHADHSTDHPPERGQSRAQAAIGCAQGEAARNLKEQIGVLLLILDFLDQFRILKNIIRFFIYEFLINIFLYNTGF